MVLAIVVFLTCSLVARAQEPPSPDADAPPADPLEASPVMPTLAWAPVIPWPQEALAVGEEGHVRLRLTLDEDGRVVAFEVVDSSAPSFGEAVGPYVPELRFTPARDTAGRPARAVIEYVHRFTLDQQPVVAIEGRVRLAGSDAAFVGAEVVARSVERPELPAATVRSGEDGRFELFDLSPGRWTLTAYAPGHRADELELDVLPGERVEVRLLVIPDVEATTGEAGETMIIFGDRLQPELTERRLDPSLVRVLPGTGGDVVRAIQTQPGVARTPFNSGALLVRGTPSDATAFNLGGTRIPIIFHFGGLSTAVNGDMLEELRFLPGSYGVRHGRRLGGLVELVPRSEPIAETQGYAAIDLLQATVMHDQVLGPRNSLSLSVRRSYFDLLLSPLVNIDPSWSVRLPGYSDAQLHLLHKGEGGATFSGMLLGSEDHLSFRTTSEEGASEESRLDLRFFRGWGSWTRPIGNAWEVELTGMLGPERMFATLEDEEKAREQATRAQGRVEFNRPVLTGGAFGWRIGLDLELAVDDTFAYSTSDLAGFYLYAEDEEGEQSFILPGLYFEQVQRAGRLTLVPGVRWDGIYSSEGYRSSAVDPRVRMQVELASTTFLDAGAGLYSQFPAPREITDNGVGNPDLGPERAAQLTMGVKHQVSPEFRLEGVAYLSLLDELIVGHDDRFTFELAPPPMAPFDLGDYANDGTGRVLGTELVAHYEDERWIAFAAFTLSRSVRQERPDGPESLFEYDQPVVITVMGSRSLPRGWRLGARGRLTEGNPYTPIRNRIYDQAAQGWVPVFSEGTTERLAPWASLDVRADKQWTFRAWALTLYVDVQNTTNRQNAELLTFSPDFSEELVVVGLPILPTFGLRGDW